MNVLLTGGTGFIGRAVARDLVRAGHDVSALVRGPRAAERCSEVDAAVRAAPGDLEDEASLAKAVAGRDAVVHLAAVVAPTLQRDADAVYRINHRATVRLATLAREAGVRQFVFSSSIAAMGFWSGMATSESTCRPVSDYGRAKLDAERGLAALAARHFRVNVLRPPTVYGPGEPYNFLQWVRAIDSGAFRLIGSGQNAFPLATTANVARAVRAAVSGLLPELVYLVADRDPYPISRIHGAVLSALGRSPPRLQIPRRLATAVGLANEVITKAIPRFPTVLTRARVRTLTVDQRFDVSPLLSRGVDLDAPLETWVEMTVRDYERRGVL